MLHQNVESANLLKDKRIHSYSTSSLVTAKPVGTCIFVVLVLIAVLVMKSLTVVPAGHVGVVDTFGSVSDNVLNPGLNFVNPFSKVVKLSVQTQRITYAEDVPTQEGMDVHLEAAGLFRLKPEKASKLYKEIGIDYIKTVVQPQFRSVLRSITSGHEAKDLYTTKARQSMTTGLLNELRTVLGKYGIDVQDTPLKKLQLPLKLMDSIQDKLRAEQESQKMQFILTRQKQEADRMVIEAKGIADYQKIISQGLTADLLTWKGIQATENLAKSANSKIVMIGGGKSGLPVILNAGDSAKSSSKRSNTKVDPVKSPIAKTNFEFRPTN